MMKILLLLAVATLAWAKDSCTDTKCSSHGTCIETESDDFLCICERGFYGKQCELSEGCHSNPCYNGGTCINNDKYEFDCLCLEGYSGKACEIEEVEHKADACARKPCQNGGLCEVVGDSYQCMCTEDFTGKNCEIEDCRCENGYCVTENGKQRCQCNSEFGFYKEGVCKACKCGKGANCTFEKGILFDEKQCVCPEGYTYFVQEGKCVGPCDSIVCQNGGNCTMTPDDSFRCLCPPYFYGEYCEKKAFCHPNPCQNDGKCAEGKDGYRCFCPPSFDGEDCENEVTVTPTRSSPETTDYFFSTSRFSGTMNPNTFRSTYFTLPTGRTYSTRWWYTTVGYRSTSDVFRSPTGRRYSTPWWYTTTAGYRHSTPWQSTTVGYRPRPDCHCENGFCEYEYDKLKCICNPGYILGEEGICKDICGQNMCGHGKCVITDNSYVCKCDDGFAGLHCDEKVQNKIWEIIEIQAPWMILAVLLLIVLALFVIVHRNKSAKKNTFIFSSSDEKCPLFEDPKFVNRLQTEILE